MDKREDLPATVSPLVTDFARQLEAVRKKAGLTFRQVADGSHYSHPPMVRATKGKTLPTWPVAKAFLTACGVVDIDKWHALWDEANEAQYAFRLASKRGWSDMGISRDEPRINLLVDRLRDIWSMTQLADVLGVLRERSERGSLSQMQKLTGIPRSTLSGWCRGARKPHADQLDKLVAALGATPTERTAFARALDALGGPRVWQGGPIVSVSVGAYVGNGGYELWVSCSGEDVEDGHLSLAPGQSPAIMGINNSPYDRTHGLSTFGQTLATEAVLPPTRRSRRQSLLGLWISSPKPLHGTRITFRCVAKTSKGTWTSTPSTTFYDPNFRMLAPMLDEAEGDEYDLDEAVGGQVIRIDRLG